MPTIENKKATISQYPNMLNCDLCLKDFGKSDVFRVVEEDGAYDNEWYAVCQECLKSQKYVEFIKNNCRR